MKLSWFNTSMAYNQYQAYIWYEQYNMDAMHNIREREFRDSGSITNTKIYFEVRATALRPRLLIKRFSLCPHRTSHIGNLHWGFAKYKLGVHNSSLQQNNLYTRDKTQQQSLLHLEGWAQSQITITSHKRDMTLSQTTITSTLRGIRH